MPAYTTLTRLLLLLVCLGLPVGCALLNPPMSAPAPTPTGLAAAPTAPPTLTAPGPRPTALPDAGTRVHAVQGPGHRSPLAGQSVIAVPGVVTALRRNGFYLQDPDPDADPATSEGLFVFTRETPTVAVGDIVSVSGRVTEFRPGGAEGQTNLTTTEIENPVVTTLARGAALPPPTVIGRAGRLPPTQTIEDDAAGDAETSGVFDPAQDGLDFYESLEGMRVQIDAAVVVGPRNRFGEIVVLADGGAEAGQRTARGGLLGRADDANPERIFVDDEALQLNGQTTPSANVGDRFAGPLLGVVDYSFGNFKVELTQAPRLQAGGLTREITAPSRPEQLVVASLNTENLDPTDVGRFEALAELIVKHLRGPDLLSVQEMQDNSGARDDGVVDASRTFTRLVEAVQAAGGPVYQWRQIDPVDGQDGGEPGGNIRVGFLFRADHGLALVDRPGGTAVAAVAVERGPDGPHLSFSPGRIDPAQPAWQASRKPLAGEFTFHGRRLFVVAAHFVSKGADQPLFGRFQPPARRSETQRLAQAAVVADFARTLLAADPQSNLIVMGDLNDFEFARPIAVLKAAGLTPLVETLPPAERYSYVFEGNSQTLDQILVSPGLLQTAAPDYDVVHVNAEFGDPVSDHDPSLVRLSLPPR